MNEYLIQESTLTGIADAIRNKHNMVLPVGYTQLSYIESNGTQYIDTSVASGNVNLSFEIQYSWTQLPDNGVYSFVLMSYYGEDYNTTRILQYGSNTTYVNFDSKAGGGSKSITINRSIDTIYTETLGDGVYKSNNQSVELLTSQGASYNGNIYILHDGKTTTAIPASIKLYYLKIWDSGLLIRNFMPCKNLSGEIGLYDVVNNVFYGNSGTGTFITDTNTEREITLISPVSMASEILSIDTSGNGSDVSGVTATASDVLYPKIFVDNTGSQITGTIETVTQASPSISINSSTGLVTASVTQSTGYVNSGTKSTTYQLSTQAAKIITPSTSSQTAVSSEKYTTGVVTVAGDSNLTSENIKSGVSIFGVSGLLGDGLVVATGSNDTYGGGSATTFKLDKSVSKVYALQIIQDSTVNDGLINFSGVAQSGISSGGQYDFSGLIQFYSGSKASEQLGIYTSRYVEISISGSSLSVTMSGDYASAAAFSSDTTYSCIVIGTA